MKYLKKIAVALILFSNAQCNCDCDNADCILIYSNPKKIMVSPSESFTVFVGIKNNCGYDIHDIKVEGLLPMGIIGINESELSNLPESSFVFHLKNFQRFDSLEVPMSFRLMPSVKKNQTLIIMLQAGLSEKNCRRIISIPVEVR